MFDQEGSPVPLGQDWQGSPESKSRTGPPMVSAPSDITNVLNTAEDSDFLIVMGRGKGKLKYFEIIMYILFSLSKRKTNYFLIL